MMSPRMLRLLGLTAGLLGCVAPPSGRPPAYPIERLTAQIQELQKYQRTMEMALGCDPNLSEMLKGIYQRCQESPPLPDVKGVAASAKEPAYCASKQIQPYILQMKKHLDVEFFELLLKVPHEVVYLNERQLEPADWRAQRLLELIKGPMLDSTRFLILTPPKPNKDQADIRIQRVRDWLLKQKLDAVLVEQPWQLDFRTKLDRFYERPQNGEVLDPTRGVWIFRTNCFYFCEGEACKPKAS